MKTFQNRLVLTNLFASVLLAGSGTHAFAPVSTSNKIQPRITAQRALPVDHQQLADAALSWDVIQQSTSHFLLADEAAVKAAGEATGWWGQYINLFKSTLLWVHGNIDGPLRSVGFDQTWGVSIALFTLSKYACLVNKCFDLVFSSNHVDCWRIDISCVPFFTYCHPQWFEVFWFPFLSSSHKVPNT